MRQGSLTNNGVKGINMVSGPKTPTRLEQSQYRESKNKLADALLDSINLMSDNSVKTSSARTLTLEAKIVEIIDKGRGIYKVQYLDNIFKATAANESNVYNIDDIVYILIPEGNFDKEIIVLSSIKSEISRINTEGKLYIDIGESLFGNTYNSDLFSKRQEEFLIEGNKSFFAKSFIEYLKDTRTFNLSCYIKTNIEANRRSGGNYGLILTIPVVDANNIHSIYTVTLDVNNIRGDAYNFIEPAFQNLYFNIPENLLFDEEKIDGLSLTSFIKNFPDQQEKDIEGQYIGERVPDVFISNINIFPTKVVEKSEKEGYYLKLRATEGSLFWTGSNYYKTLYPDLYLGGRSTKVDTFDCYWFKENYRVTVGTENYNRYGGIGWEIINDKIEKEDLVNGQINFDYNVEQRKYLVSLHDVYSEIKYKCVLVKDELVLSDTITLRNIVDPAELILTTTQENGSTVYTTGIGTATLQVKYHDSDLSDDRGALLFDWKRFNRYGELCNDGDNKEIFKPEGVAGESIEENGKEYISAKVSIPVKEIYDFNIIYCTAYKVKTVGNIVKEDIIGTVSIKISTEDAPSYKVQLENADKVYKYDSDGNSPLVANYDGPASSKLKAITPILARAYKDNGMEFNEDEYAVSTIIWKIPKHSMITIEDIDLYNIMDQNSDPEYNIIKGNYIDYKQLNYAIVNPYNKSLNNNTIKVTIESTGGLSINGMATIKFLKDGESGTNGSKYAAVVVFGKDERAYEEPDEDGNLSKLQLIYVESDSETSKPKWYFYNKSNKNNSIVELTSDFWTTGTAEEIEKKREDWGFDIKLYCDGEPVDVNAVGGVDLQYEWNIFDYQNSLGGEILNPIEEVPDGKIHIKTEDPTSIDPYEGVIRWPQGRTCCATLEVKCTARKSNIDSAGDNSDNKMFEEFIYAYYPIEMTYSRTSDIIIKGIIPHLDGGFNQVLYSVDGKHPQFDTTSNFTFVDELTKEAENENTGQDYLWEVTSSLTMEDVIKEGNEVEKLEKIITPATTCFFDGDNNQYVKVRYGYDVDEDSARAKMEECISIRNNYEAQLDLFGLLTRSSSIIKEFELLKNQMLQVLSTKDSLLIKKNELYSVLMTAILMLQEIVESNKNILTGAGVSYLKRLFDNSQSVYKVHLIGAVNNLERMPFNGSLSSFQGIFETFGQVEECEPSGEIAGTLIKVELYEEDSYGYIISGTSKKVKNKFLDRLREFNSFVHSSYAPYYAEIVRDNSIYGDVRESFVWIRDRLDEYIDRAEWQDLILKEFEETIGEELCIIENPYYNVFYPRYENISQYIENMTDENFKSFNDIQKVINFIDGQLSPYYEFSLASKMNIIELLMDAAQVMVDGLQKSIDLGKISDLIHVKPIIILLDRTGLSCINGWDGNKLEINEKDGTILAPMVGAGMKENGDFTGVLMGVVKSGQGTEKRVGLFGWAGRDGESIFLNARTGSAAFGTALTGKIVIDPSTKNLRIVDSNYMAHEENPDYYPLSGMCINFTGDREAQEEDRKAGYIHFGDAKGKIFSGEHNVYDTENGKDPIGFYLAHDGFSIGSGVHIKSDGNFLFGKKDNNNRYIEWKNNMLTIGNGVSVTASKINANVGIKCGGTESNPACSIDGASGSFRAGYGNFRVDSNGTVYIGGNATIKGVLTASKGSMLGSWEVIDGVDTSTVDGSLFGKNGATPTIKLVPKKALIGFTDSSSNSSGSSGYVYLGGAIRDPATSVQRCDKNYICIYTSLKGEPSVDPDTGQTEYNYGKMRAKGFYSDFGVLGQNYLYLGCHNSNGQKFTNGTMEKTIKNGAIRIGLDGIEKYNKNTNKWNFIVRF